MSFETFLRLLRDTYDRPQDLARSIMAMQVPGRLALMALALVAILTTGFAMGAAGLGRLLAPAPVAQDPVLALYDQPLALAAMQFGGMLLGAVLIHRVGRIFGGTGTWAQTLPLVTWLQIVFMVLQVAQLLLALAIPILMLPALLFTVFSVFFLTAQFIAALHGFVSVGKVIGMMILTIFALSFLLAVAFVAIFPVPHV